MKAFGLETVTIDGHDHSEILTSLNREHGGGPRCVIAKTVKGFGLSEMRNNPAWHHASPTAEQFLVFVKELQK
jgi:transketolase